MRTIVFLGLYWGSAILGNHHVHMNVHEGDPLPKAEGHTKGS